MGSSTIWQCLRIILVFSILQGLTLYPLVAAAAKINYQVASVPQDPQQRSDTDTHLEYPNSGANAVHKRATEQCHGFPGDQDTYGMGIRIGLYFQWVTSSLAYNFVPTEAVTMRGVNNCFQAAMFAGLLFLTITKLPQGQLYAAEAYLMLLFCMGGVCSGTIDLDEGINTGENGPTTVAKGYAYLDASTLGGYVRLLLGCGFIAYGLWFVFVGMDQMLQPGYCRYAFFFARVDLAGWFRTLLKVLFICASIPAFLSLLIGTASLIKEGYKFFFKSGWRGRAKRQQGHEAPEEPGLQTLKLRKGNVGFSGALLLFIIAVELTIRWNHIEGVMDVGSTGQLLPVIIGVGGVGRVLITLISNLLEEAALADDRRRNVNSTARTSHLFTPGVKGQEDGYPLPFIHDTSGPFEVNRSDS